jgi:hypothetical protein
MKIAIAAVVGGVILFVWSAIAHMATPLGTAGLSVLPNEDAVRNAMRTNIPRSGLYLFPAPDLSGKMTTEQQKTWEAKLRSGPTGLLAYNAQGGEGLSARRLIAELISNVLAAAIAAILLSMMTAPYMARVFSTALLALFAFLTIAASRWIWDSYPTAFVAAELAMEFIGWFVAGLAIAKIVPVRES